MDTPLVSIIIPVFNSEKTIEETINSVKSQSYSNWEIVCVDDGSSDGSAGIIEGLSKSDPRIRYIRRNRLPKGGSTCRNIGASSSKGEYLIFLDSDDLLSDSCLETRVHAIHNTDNLFVAYPMASFYDGDRERLNQPDNIKIKDYDYLFASSISAWQITSPIFKRDFFISLNGFDESFPRLQDVEFHLRAITSSYGYHKVESFSEADCYYRLSPSGYNLTKLQNSIVAYEKFIALLLSLLDNGGLSNKNKLSNSMILLFSNISIIKYQIWKNGGDISGWSSLLDRRIKSYINTNAWRIVIILNNSYKKTIIAKLHFFMARVLLHYGKNYFKTRT